MPDPNRASNYFQDGKTVIDFVIVFHRYYQQDKEYKVIQQFLDSLKNSGLEVELDDGFIYEYFYGKVSLPEKIADSTAELYGLDIQNAGHAPIPERQIFKFKLFQTPLTENEQDRFIRKRGTTSAERILLINQILADAKFGNDNEYHGIKAMEKLKLVKTYYPLHEYDPIWEHTEMVNDRQKLLDYWANFRVWYKEQPLNLIEKYFGTEIAFYFAWLGFFNKMLIPPAILSMFIFVIRFFRPTLARLEEVCNSEQIMCPLCTKVTGCIFEKLNQYCTNAKLAFFFDNNMAVWFAILMSFWATIFLNLWTRYENRLKVRWNVKPTEASKVLDGYKNAAEKLRISPITGELEAIIPLRSRLYYNFRSYASSLFWILVVLFGCIIVIYYSILVKTLMYTSAYRDLVVMMTSACLQIIFIKAFRKGYENRSIAIAKLKIPRTQQEFDDSVTKQLYLLNFVNYYMSLFYIPFVQGRFHSPNYTPGFIDFNTDTCDPTGCIVQLCIRLTFVMIFKNLFGNILLLIRVKLHNYLHRKDARVIGFQFEGDMHLAPTRRYMIASHFADIVIQYGFVTFFIGAFSFVPLLALVDNIIYLRIMAYKLLVRDRRAIPYKAAGLGVWMSILKIMTFLSTVTNAFVIGFTSDFVIRLIYYFHVDPHLKGFINSTLSIYDMNDFHGAYRGNYRYCFYRASRNPPDHPQKYEYNDSYWYEIGMRLLAVIIFSHVVGIFNGFLHYALPDVPQTVKESLQQQKDMPKDVQSKVFKTKYDQFQKKLNQTTVKIRRDKADLEETLN